MLLQNVWISTHSAKSYKDNNGKPVNDCPQDLMIPTRLIHMFKSSFTRGSKMTVLACGESSGWASVAAQRQNVDCVATEVDSYSYFFLCQRLLREVGQLVLQEANKHIFWKKVFKNWSAHCKNNQALTEKLEEMTAFLKESGALNGLNEQAATQLVETLSSET